MQMPAGGSLLPKIEPMAVAGLENAPYVLSSSPSTEDPRMGRMKRPRDERKMSSRGKERRTRTIFNLAQLNALERIFLDEEYPDGELKTKIAQRLEVEEGTVQIWFQNRRAKKKRLQRGQGDTNDPCLHHDTVPHSDIPLQPLLPGPTDYHPGVADCFLLPPASVSMTQPNVALDSPVLPVSIATWNPHLPDDSVFPPSNQLHSVPQMLTAESSPRCGTATNPPGHQSNQNSIEVKTRAPLHESRSVGSRRNSGSIENPADATCKWPVKEPPTSQSGFGKLDFPQLPRVCIRHENSAGGRQTGPAGQETKLMGRKVITLGRLHSKIDRHSFAELRQRVLKKDPPRSPPPNQSCATLPRSELNELTLALRRHGFGSGSKSSHRGRFSGNLSDDWSSSSDESSDSEGLAPPRRRRRLNQVKKVPPPNKVCTSVPLMDRTLPTVVYPQAQEFGKNADGIHPLAVSLSSPPSPSLSSENQPNLNDSDLLSKNPPEDGSDWDSDDSVWAYYDPGPASRRSEVTGDSITSLGQPQQSDDGLYKRQEPKSAPPNLDLQSYFIDQCTADPGYQSLTRSSCNVDLDEFSEVTLAKEFAEMLPSPLGEMIPVSHEEAVGSTQVNQPGRRARIHSDSVLTSSYDRAPPAPEVSNDVGDHAGDESSSSSLKSTDTCLSNLSALFNLPVSPSDLNSHFLEEAAPLPSTTHGEFEYSKHDSKESVAPQNNARSDQTSIYGNFDNHMESYQLQNNNVQAFDQNNKSLLTTYQHPIIYSESTSGVTLDFAQHATCRTVPTGPVPRQNATFPGVIRPIPTHPVQMTTMQKTTPQTAVSSNTMPLAHEGPSSSVKSSHLYLTSTGPINQFGSSDRSQLHLNDSHNRLPQTRDSHNGYQPAYQRLHHSSKVSNAAVVHHPPTRHSQGFTNPNHPSLLENHYGRAAPADVGVNSTTQQQKACHNSNPSHLPNASLPPNVSFPPNQVCTAVPDAVSSQGLMARYLAWTQGRIVHQNGTEVPQDRMVQS
ncbi:uncharacterized protein [Diadema setosum]|uniref:uncharacterized protein n=1 Tax=Diadema setosum TaxID=31175 RepID=UPI003B3AB368